MAGTFSPGADSAAPGARLCRRPSLYFVLALSWSWAVPAMAESLTEQEAVARALARPAMQAQGQSSLQAAQSAVSEAGLWPNPVVSIDRSQVGGASGETTESTYQITQTFDVSGRRQLGLKAAVQRLQTASAQQQAQRLQTTADVLHAFAELLYRQQQLVILEQWQLRIAGVFETVQKLAKAGEVSGYDRRRLQQELQTVAGRRDQAAADLLLAQHRLAGLTGVDDAGHLAASGQLVHDTDLDLAQLRGLLSRRPDIKALQAQSEALALEGRAAGRQWLSDITLGLGQKMVDTPSGGGHGLALSVAMALPVFDRGNAKAARLQAEAESLRAEQLLRHREAEATLNGRWGQMVSLRRAAARFREDSLRNAHELSRIAETAYRAGEVGVLELLDAYRTEMSTAQDALELEQRIRLAGIELNILVGVAP